MYFAEASALAETKSITVRSVTGEKYDNIVGYDLSEKPFYREPGWDDEDEDYEHSHAEIACSDEDIPF